MEKTISTINSIMEKYYVTGEIKDDNELRAVLKNKLDKVLFNDAVFALIGKSDLDTTQNVILVGFLLDYYNETNEKPMRELLLQTFHNSHEDIVGLFQSTFNNSSENIPILLKALKNIPEYLQPDDFKYPYIRKIIYAIGAQPQPESLLALERLASETDDEKIKELALHQLEKRRRLGRWEQKQINGID